VPARMLVGRSPACALRLDDRHVSGEHAALIWTGQGWEIRDLGSRNGTFVDGDRVQPGEPRTLPRGAKIGFGHSDDPWVLVDAGPPGAVAHDLDGDEVRVAEGGMLALPSEEEPEVVLYANRSGHWVIEADDAPSRAARAEEVVRAGGRSWRLYVPEPQEGTAAVDSGPSIDTVALRFAVSRDEEHVTLTIVHRGVEIPLEPREHGYTLLTLARQRLQDADLPLAEQGWIDRELLLRMLGLDANALNVAIYRARNQISDAGVDGAAGIVEVRRGQRRLGVEPERIEVTRP